MSYDMETLKKLRDETGVSIMACKKALEGSGGNVEKAADILRKESEGVALKKSQRQTNSGVIDAYIHSNKKIGVLVELRSETDFVAMNPEFKTFAHDLAMHITATNPGSVKDLLGEESVKDPGIKIEALLKSAIQKFGENIEIARFERFSL